MVTTDFQSRRTRLINSLHARFAARGKFITEFQSTPDPKMIGYFARGRQLLDGKFLFSGHLIEAPGMSIWDTSAHVDTAKYLAHGFDWLDDLAAVGDNDARVLAQEWLQDWIVRYGNGTGDGWTPDLTGRRLIRWVAHGFFLLRGADKEASEAYFRSAAQQALFLSRRWKSARPGLPRFEVLAGMIYAGLSLRGMEGRVQPAIEMLTRDCKTQIGEDGGIPSRNPEELLEVLTLLTWVETALRGAQRPVPEELMKAMYRIAPTLRAMRHTDGGLARFHGGGRGKDGWLDQALAAAGTLEQPGRAIHMGFGRLSGGRTSVVIDVGKPPTGIFAGQAHASTLAMEVTSGRRPLIVNCGSGVSFGPDWRRAGRATPSHSTLSIEGVSSSRIVTDRAERELLKDGPRSVQAEFEDVADGTRLATAHDGYRRSHGLTHVRMLDVSADGRAITGEDLLTTLAPSDEPLFDGVKDAETVPGIPWTIRFHLHPEVAANADSGGSVVSLTLKSGEIWVLRQEGAQEMRLERSVYLENGRLRPRETQQVVLSGRSLAYATRIRWSLSKAQKTPIALRDFDDPTTLDF